MTTTTVTVELEVTATGHVVPYDPGRISGPPEQCYPPEGGYAEDLCVKLRVPVSKLGSVRPDGTLDVDITDLLSEFWRENCEDQLMDAHEANDH